MFLFDCVEQYSRSCFRSEHIVDHDDMVQEKLLFQLPCILVAIQQPLDVFDAADIIIVLFDADTLWISVRPHHVHIDRVLIQIITHNESMYAS